MVYIYITFDIYIHTYLNWLQDFFHQPKHNKDETCPWTSGPIRFILGLPPKKKGRTFPLY